MMRIGLLSDTHGWIYPGIYDFFADCDEIWHAGDIGSVETYEKLSKFKTIRAVYGNIDGQDLRLICPEIQLFYCEGLKVMVKHIGGYPGRYDRSVKDLILKESPGLFISGHSHILKVMYDKKLQLMHMNPGAAGRNGLHKQITCLRFSVQGEQISELEILEKDRRSL